jgi:N-acetylglucosaminyldiphosphoundecaprenol N-acetyl-beta-D-mannosaminyltransferase
MSRRIRLFGIEIDALNMHQAVSRVLAWTETGPGRCHYVVTPNVDHTVMYQHRADLRRAYRGASMVLADGAPVVFASRLLRRGLPERVAGSDLVPALFDAACRRSAPGGSGKASSADGPTARQRAEHGGRPLRVFLLGAAPGVATKAAWNIESRWPSVRVVGVLSPPPGFEHAATANRAIFRAISAARPEVLIVGFGAPKQEAWVSAHCHRIEAPVALCVGATIDFLAGHRRRSPRWMRRVGLEWVHRLVTEPRRLGARYARDLWIFPQLVWQERRRAAA